MMRKIIVIGCFCFLWLGFLPAEATEPMAPANPESTGYALLDKLMSGFAQMAQKGTGGFNAVNEMMQSCMADLKKAKEQNQVDALFYMRYRRILEVMKLTIAEDASDREGILDSLVLREIEKFLDEVTGNVKDFAEVQRGIGIIAGAIADEIVNLHIYLDGQKNRKQLIKKYTEWTPTPKK